MSAALASEEFLPGGEFTVGAEEELVLLDQAGGLLRSGAEEAVASVRRAVPPGTGTVSVELFASQIEFATGICAGADGVEEQLATMRSAFFATGGRAMAVGVHPAAPFGDAALTAGPHYDQVARDLAGLLRTPTSALQVHVGLPDVAAALAAYNGIRHRLVVLQALAGASPFWHGRDSGLASTRWAVISSYPRGGVPPHLATWEEYASRVRATAASAGTDDLNQVWWDARLRPALGTIEIRVMDAQPSLQVAAGLVALAQGLVKHAVEHPRRCELPHEVLGENSFRVARHGLETTVVDVDGATRPVRDVALVALRDARSALVPEGHDDALEVVEKLLADATEPARQRQVHEDRGMDGLLEDLVSRTCAR
ncbi:carboxylate-amine ligase [Marmoricola sp. OAE513]|uniref:carboxylate-amine ligase n=1 Tax=Marmoricola sp. OAE513 TaxID=2817894 RepID=UPI001AE6ED9E